MHYELYIDSLFLVNFVMNLYLLLLVDLSTLRTATRSRLLLGAGVGGVCGLLPFMLPGPILTKVCASALAGTVGMILITFPVRGIRMFLKLLKRLLLYSFCMGGVLLFLIRSFPRFRSFFTGISGILGVGGISFLFLSRARERKEPKDSICRAELVCPGERFWVTALVDSGNSLVEPISGKPVCIVSEQLLNRLREKLPPGYRAIPYHSIGKKRGILEGYLLPELIVELDGIRKSFTQIYIAASPEGISETDDEKAESVKMIINPMLFLKGSLGGPRRRQNERIYDFKSGNTGQNAD